MTDITMPSFDFSGDYQMTLEDIENEASKSKQRYLRPGLYDARITGAAFKNVSEKDSAWGIYHLTLTATNGAEIRHTVLVPLTRRSQYLSGPGKSTMLPFINYRKLLEALGVEIKVLADVEKGTKKLFSDPTKLQDKELSIKVGYRRPYIGFLGKTEDGGKLYTVLMADGTAHPKFADQTYSSWDAAEEAAIASNITLDKYVNVIEVKQVAKSAKSAAVNF